MLDSSDTVIKFAETMKYNGKTPKVKHIEGKYETGIKLKKKEMDIYESVLERKEGIKKWFVKIVPSNCRKILNNSPC